MLTLKLRSTQPSPTPMLFPFVTDFDPGALAIKFEGKSGTSHYSSWEGSEETCVKRVSAMHPGLSSEQQRLVVAELKTRGEVLLRAARTAMEPPLEDSWNWPWQERSVREIKFFEDYGHWKARVEGDFKRARPDLAGRVLLERWENLNDDALEIVATNSPQEDVEKVQQWAKTERAKYNEEDSREQWMKYDGKEKACTSALYVLWARKEEKREA